MEVVEHTAELLFMPQATVTKARLGGAVNAFVQRGRSILPPLGVSIPFEFRVPASIHLIGFPVAGSYEHYLSLSFCPIEGQPPVPIETLLQLGEGAGLYTVEASLLSVNVSGRWSPGFHRFTFFFSGKTLSDFSLQWGDWLLPCFLPHRLGCSVRTFDRLHFQLFIPLRRRRPA